ncbi:hypothetical protein [Shouchella lonarensis]|uniref:hypothetical protein n=1 Tax=Shouchella lonarensis TaxID=1464122 RepID=UPI000B854289|nr:hypothetical protein [Shouchella lonarensis]
MFLWLPNIVFQLSTPYWLLTLVVSPVGMFCAVLAEKKSLIVLNLVMFFSFFLVMLLGYVINGVLE